LLRNEELIGGEERTGVRDCAAFAKRRRIRLTQRLFVGRFAQTVSATTGALPQPR